MRRAERTIARRVPNITLVPIRKSEALLLAAQRARWAKSLREVSSCIEKA
jgi:hypothetical protein